MTRHVGRRSGRILALLFLPILFLLPVSASADPLSVHGHIDISSNGGDYPDIPDPLLEFLFYFVPMDGLPGVESVFGDAVATSEPHGTLGGLQVSRAPLPAALVPGVSYDLSTSGSWTAGVMQDYTLEESTWYRTSGTFDIAAGDALLVSNGQLTGEAPFTFSALVRAFDWVTGAPLFDREFTGFGTARVFLDPARPSFFVYSYEVVPTPEPGTLLLLGGGLGLLAARRRR